MPEIASFFKGRGFIYPDVSLKWTGSTTIYLGQTTWLIDGMDDLASVLVSDIRQRRFSDISLAEGMLEMVNRGHFNLFTRSRLARTGLEVHIEFNSKKSKWELAITNHSQALFNIPADKPLPMVRPFLGLPQAKDLFKLPITQVFIAKPASESINIEDLLSSDLKPDEVPDIVFDDQWRECDDKSLFPKNNFGLFRSKPVLVPDGEVWLIKYSAPHLPSGYIHVNSVILDSGSNWPITLEIYQLNGYLPTHVEVYRLKQQMVNLAIKLPVLIVLLRD